MICLHLFISIRQLKTVDTIGNCQRPQKKRPRTQTNLKGTRCLGSVELVFEERV